MLTGALCFVLMPFQKEVDETGQSIDFPRVYDALIRPAIIAAGMTPLRADEDPGSAGIFQKSMFERLALCEFAVADLSAGNANVFYELGVRHGLRPHSTVLMFREGWRLPLDVAHGTAVAYPVDIAGSPCAVESTVRRLVERLKAARSARVDSPVHQLVTGLPVGVVDHERLDAFRTAAEKSERFAQEVAEALSSGVDGLRELEARLGPLEDIGLSAALTLLMAFRSLSLFADIVRVVDCLALPVARVESVRQMYAWALNRCGRDSEAERVIAELARTRPSSETFGVLGRIYKDRWAQASTPFRRAGLLSKAIDAYLRGFEVDWRDPYPGVNALTLMHLSPVPDPRFGEVLPVVDYAVKRRLKSTDRDPDYWDHASDMSIGVLTFDPSRASKALESALAVVRDEFETLTTSRDLAWIVDVRRKRGEDVAWIEDLLVELPDVTGSSAVGGGLGEPYQSGRFG